MNANKTRAEHSLPALVEGIQTPALIWNMDILDERLAALAGFAERQDCALLYSVKASGVGAVLKKLAPIVSGFACSSPFEARLARQVIGEEGSVHLTSPALHPGDLSALKDSCDHISFNSLQQWTSLREAFGDNIRCGIRVNPGISIVGDPRFDPCRENSKLGIPIAALAEAYEKSPEDFGGVDGLHIHTACGNRSFKGLAESVGKIETALPELMRRIRWFNLGGGYFFDKIRKTKTFADTVLRLRRDYGLKVFIEPGTAMVQNAASVITTVVDIIETGPKEIAVLDTSVNHMPEVFTYQFRPPVKEARRGGGNTYILAGATCLAGDLLGTYAFDQPLKIGQPLTIEKMGAYTHGQSHWFNGVNLPAIHTFSKKAGLKLERAFTFRDFMARCAAGS